MDTTAAQVAIKSALSGDWELAISQNIEILKSNPDDIDTLNRLAKAYAQVGKIKKACEIASQTLKIDPENIIAKRSIEKWKDIDEGQVKGLNAHTTIDSFLEDPGKTKLITLINPGDEATINKLDYGDSVNILCHSHKVSVVTNDKKYIGRIPDDIALKMRNLTKLGFTYSALIKSIESREVKVFVREISRPKSDTEIISFPAEKIDYISYTSPDLVHKDTPDMEVVEEATFIE